MANARFTQFFYTKHTMPILLDCNFEVGGTGAVGTLKGPGITGVTRLAAGVYKISLQDNYYKFFGISSFIASPLSGSNVAATALTPGVVYEITALGTTTTANWVTAGVPANITPAVGVAFLAAATSSGNGTAKILGVSGIAAIEVVGDPNVTIAAAGGSGGYVVVKCLGATAAGDTTLVATDPASGSNLQVSLYLSNSSVLVAGE